jgi:hypothetical protein
MADTATHDEWHSREHLPERLGIPGFLRARRCASAQRSNATLFVLYEVADLAVMTSPAYLVRLNSPTSWTTRMMASVKALSRTLCRVAATHGQGVGSHLLTIRLAPRPDQERKLCAWLAKEALSAAVRAPGIVGAHLLQRDVSLARPETRERQLRRRQDDFVDWVVLIEGYSASAVRKVGEELLNPGLLAKHGAEETITTDRFVLAHLMSAADVEIPARSGAAMGTSRKRSASPSKGGVPR